MNEWVNCKEASTLEPQSVSVRGEYRFLKTPAVNIKVIIHFGLQYDNTL